MAKEKPIRSYFTHDSGARNSEKLLRVRMRHGAAGYGVFFMILERLREDTNYMSVKDYNMIAFDLRVDASLVKSIVEEFGLFVFTENGKYFYSEEFSRRMGIKDEATSRRSEAGRKGMASRYAHEAIDELQQKANNVITMLPENPNNVTTSSNSISNNADFRTAEVEEEQPKSSKKAKKTTRSQQKANNVITMLPENPNNVTTMLEDCYNKKSKEKKRINNTPPQTPPHGGFSSSHEEEIFFENSKFQVRNANTLTTAVTSMGATQDYLADILRMSNNGEPNSPIWELLDQMLSSGGRISMTDTIRAMAVYERQGLLHCKSRERLHLESLLAQTVKPEEVKPILDSLTFPERERRCLEAIEEIRKSNGKITQPAKFIASELRKVPVV